MKSPLNEGAFPAPPPPLQVLVVCSPSRCFLGVSLRRVSERGWKIIRQSAGKVLRCAAADYYSDFRDIEIKVRPIGESIHSVPRAMLTEFHSPITNPFDSRSRNATNNDESDSPLRLGLCGSGFGVRDSALAFPPPTYLLDKGPFRMQHMKGEGRRKRVNKIAARARRIFIFFSRAVEIVQESFS